MSEKLAEIRLPIALLLIFFFGKLLMGAFGVAYETGAQVFAMVPLTIHLCLIWGAIAKAIRGKGVGGAVQTGLLIALVSQILIFGATIFSYLLGVDTHFNHPMAVARTEDALGFGDAFAQRAVGLVVNLILGAIAALLGYAMGSLVPRASTR